MKISMYVASIDDPENPSLEGIDTETCRCLQTDDVLWKKNATAWDFASEVVDYFNRTLKPGETKRILISVQEMP